MLDGDIDWKPSAIQLLLNDLLKNEQTGAVCARIMPSGSGE
jgi:chitin synthase